MYLECTSKEKELDHDDLMNRLRLIQKTSQALPFLQFSTKKGEPEEIRVDFPYTDEYPVWILAYCRLMEAVCLGAR